MIALLNIGLLGLLIWAVTRHFYKDMGPVVYVGMAAKLLAAIGLGIAYRYIWEGGDTVALYEAIHSHNRTHGSTLGTYLQGLLAPIDWVSGNPRSVFFIRLMSPIGIATGHDYWLMSSYLAVFSFWCTWSLIATLINGYPNFRWVWITCLGFLPSFLFWSSGLLKDTLANACSFYVIAVVLSAMWQGRPSLGRVLLAGALFLILFFVRHYLAGMVTMAASVAVTLHVLARQRLIVRFTAILLVLSLSVFSFRYFYKVLRPERLPLTVYELHEQIKSKSDSNAIDFQLQPTWASLVSNMPVALFTGIFRPWPWEIKQLVPLLQALENLFAFVLTCITLWFARRIRWNPIVFSACLFIVVMAVMLTLATPNFGSLSRYKVGFSPLLFALLSLIPWQRYFEKEREMG